MNPLGTIEVKTQSERCQTKPNEIMKTKMKLFLGLLLAAGLSTSAYSQRANNSNVATGVHKSATTAEEIQGMKKGDRYATVCMECKSITVKEIEDEKDAEALCHDGGELHCDACEKKVKIKRMGPRSQTIGSEVVYVNGEGKECMFIVPLKE